jgi:hypothetical protein
MKKLLLIFSLALFVGITVSPDVDAVRTEQTCAVATATFTSFV